MRNLLKATVSAAYIMLCAGSVHAEENLLIAKSLDEPQGYRQTINGRAWVIAFKQGTPQGTTTEWVPEGQKIEAWKELITVQTFPSAEEDSPKQFMQRLNTLMIGTCPNVVWKTLEDSPKEAVSEWEVKNCPGQDNQLEVDRIITGRIKPSPKIIFVLHYATKNVPVDDKAKAEFLSVLKNTMPPEKLQDK